MANSLVKAPGSIWSATGRKEKIPPPPLLITTTVTGGWPGRSRSSSSPLASCWKLTSPMSSVTGWPRPAAYPAAALTTPSMPLAPRLAATGTPGPDPDPMPPPPLPPLLFL